MPAANQAAARTEQRERDAQQLAKLGGQPGCAAPDLRPGSSEPKLRLDAKGNVVKQLSNGAANRPPFGLAS